MQIVYLSHDEVNTAVANRLARRLGLDLTVVTVKDADQAVAAEHLVLDLDHLPGECKSKLFHRAGSGEIRTGITVHSYNLSPSEVKALQAAGVRVARRLVAGTLAPQPVTVTPSS